MAKPKNANHWYLKFKLGQRFRYMNFAKRERHAQELRAFEKANSSW